MGANRIGMVSTNPAATAVVFLAMIDELVGGTNPALRDVMRLQFYQRVLTRLGVPLKQSVVQSKIERIDE